MKTKNNSTILKNILLLSALAVVFVLAPLHLARAAGSINLTAYIIGKNNKNIANGEYDVRFAIYQKDRDTLDPYPSNSDPQLWQETQKIYIYEGTLVAYLGASTPIPDSLNFSNGDYYVGIRIGTDSEMYPRKKLGAVPSAVNSSFLDGKAVGTKSGDIVALGKNGQIDQNMIPDVTTVGVITKGTWNGEVLDSSYIASDLTGKTISGISFESQGNSKLTINGTVSLNQDLLTTSTPTFASLKLTNIGQAGTIAYSDGEKLVFTDQGAAGQVLLSEGNGKPQWGSISASFIAPNSLDFAQLKDSLTLDADTTIDTNGHNLDINGVLRASSLVISGSATIGTLGLNLYTNTSFIPSTAGLNLGSSTSHWANLYVDNIAVGTLDVSNANVSGTSSQFFSINSSATNETDMGIRMYRGATLNDYASLTWDSSAHGFKFYAKENTDELADLTVNTISANNFYGSMGGGNIVPDGFSQGPLVYGGSGGVLSQDSNLFWDATNNRLGVGTGTPGAPLHVIGEAWIGDSSTERVVIQSPGQAGINGLRIRLKTVTTDNIIMQLNDTSSTFPSYINTTSLGIGTTSPYGKLNISGAPVASASYGTLSLGGGAFDGSTAGKFVGNTNGTSLAVNEVTGYAGSLMDLQVGGVSKFNIGSSGQVTSGNLFLPIIAGNSGSTTSLVIYPWGNGNSGSSGDLTGIKIGGGSSQNIRTSGIHNWLSINPTYNQVASTAANTDLLINRTETAVGSGTQLLIDAQVGGVSKFNVSNTGQGYFSGIVGIGTVNPSAKLNVAGVVNIGTTQSLRINPEYPTTGELQPGVLVAGYGSTSNLDIITNGQGTAGIKMVLGYSNGTNWLSGLELANTASGYGNLILMKSGGNVGIGTTSPAQKLEVVGSAILRTEAIPSSVTSNLLIYGDTNANQTIWNQGGAAVLALRSGYNSATSVANGSMLGDIQFTGGYGSNMVNTANIRSVVDGAPTYSGGAMVPSRLEFLTTALNTLAPSVVRMVIKNDGNVGIGTTSPANSLYIKASAAGKGITIEDDDTTDKLSFAINGGAGSVVSDNRLKLVSSGGYAIELKTLGAPDAMFISNAGNVGIGTTTPYGKLNVSGSPVASANYGTLSVGGGAFDGSTAGKFVGSANGTSLAVNEVSGYTGNLLDLQINGVSRINFTAGGFTMAAGTTIYAQTITSINQTTTLSLFPYNDGVITGTADSKGVVIGGHSATNSRTAGIHSWFSVLPIYNQASGTASNTDLLINRTETSVGSGAQLLIDAQVGGASKFSVDNAGKLIASSTINSGVGINSPTISRIGAGTMWLGSQTSFTGSTNANPYIAIGGDIRTTSNNNTILSIAPTYNQASGTSANTDLLINRTETAVGSGAQLLIDAQVGGASKFSVDNTGTVTAANAVNIAGATAIGGQLNVGAGAGTIYGAIFSRITGANNGTIIGNSTQNGTGTNYSVRLAPAFTAKTSGNYIAVSITPTYNNSTGTSVANTDLLINRSETSLGTTPGAQYLIDAQVGGVTKFNVSNTGSVLANGYNALGGGVVIGNLSGNSVGGFAVMLQSKTLTQTSGSGGGVLISPTYNQTSGTASNTDLLINRTETAVGSGAQLLIDAQVGGSSKFNVDNTGMGYFASGIYVGAQQLSVPDYVFENGYNLMSITELESYVKTNKHLPGILDQNQIQKNGLNYSTMIMGLLEKTEENTLYTIQNSNQITDIKTQNDSLTIKTDQNITTIAQLQTSVDEQFGKIQKSLLETSNNQDANSKQISNINDQIASHEAKITSLENLTATLQKQMDDLSLKTNSDLNLAQLDLNTQQVSMLSTLLGVERVSDPADVDILGTLSAKITQTGSLAVTTSDKNSKTIGDGVIKAGDSSVKINTLAVDDNSKVFVTAKDVTDQPLSVTSVNAGKGFTVEVKSPVTADVGFDWWVVEAK